MDLFQIGDFTVADDAKLTWKIECDALSEGDWSALAVMYLERCHVEPFEWVIGVPRGGIPFADALTPYTTPGANRILVVDDVWMTGGSMNRFITDYAAEHGYAIPFDRAVAFARNPAPVPAVFTMAWR